MKRYAEIDGKKWQADYPFCAGCPELVLNGGCAWEGNGCRYPDRRKERPISFRRAFFQFAEPDGPEKFAEKLGSCIEEEGS